MMPPMPGGGQGGPPGGGAGFLSALLGMGAPGGGGAGGPQGGTTLVCPTCHSPMQIQVRPVMQPQQGGMGGGMPPQMMGGGMPGPSGGMPMGGMPQ